MIWSCGHRSRSPMCTSYLIKTPGDHWGKAESIQLCDLRVGQTTTGAEAQFWLRQPYTQPPLINPSSLRLLPLPSFNEGLGISPWENCGIKDVCRYVLEHFDALMHLIIFPWNKKVNFSSHFLILFCRPSIFVTHFAAYPGFCNGGGSRRGGITRRKSPSGIQGKAPVGVLGDEVLQKLKQNVKLVYNF